MTSRDFVPFALVADDDPLVRMHAVDILVAAGFRAYEAADVHEALELLRARHDSIRLLFTDVQMPPGTLNGFDLAQKCAATWPDIRIIIASGLMKPCEGDLPQGAVFIEKPYTDRVVHDHLHTILPQGLKFGPLKKADP